MAYTLNRRLAELINSNGQLVSGKISNGYISTDHLAGNSITQGKLHSTFALPASAIGALNTSNLSESGNLYYTNARADARIAAANTGDLTEGSNLYYLDSRVQTYLSGNRSYGNITTTGYLRGPASFTIDPAGHGDNSGTVVIAGNLQVDGTQTTINSTTVSIDDLNFTIASDAADSSAANGAGITIGGAAATMLYTHATTSFDFNKPVNVTGAVTSTGLLTTNGELQVNGAGTVAVFEATDGAAYIQIKDDDGTSGFIGVDAGKMVFQTPGSSFSSKLVITSDGNVGIGDPSPDQKLVVTNGNIKLKSNADGNTGILMLYDAAGVQSGQVYPSAGDLRIWSPNDVLILPTGNVGVGTDAPDEKLHVAGQVSVEGAGNTNRGNLILGAHGSGSAKWAVLAATSFNDATGSGNGSAAAGNMLIGGYSDASGNTVYIGGGPYEVNPATGISFNTHSATTHAAGGTTRMTINSSGHIHMSGSLAVAGILTTASSPAANSVGDLKVIPSANSTAGVGFAGQVLGVNISSTLSSNAPKQGSTWGGVTGSAAIALQADDNSYGQFQVWTAPQDSSANTVLTPRFWIAGNGAATFAGNLNVTGTVQADNLTMLDNEYIRLGNSNDLQIFCDGTDGYIRNHVSGGSIYNRAHTNWVVAVNASDGGADDAIKALRNGAVELYHDGDKKLETTSTGVLTTGTVSGMGFNAPYNTLGQTSSGAMLILGHNAVVASGSNIVKVKNTGYHSTFIKMYYNQGITFHSTAGTQTAGTELMNGTGANSLEHMRMTNNGKLGIGTPNPNLKLHVEEDTDTWVGEFKNTRSAGGYGLRIDNSGAGSATDTRYALGVYTPGNSGFFVRNNGKVGIGTTAPDSVLEVVTNSSSIDYTLRLKNTNTTDDNGTAVLFQGKDTSGNDVSYGQLRFKYTNHVTEKSQFELWHMNNSGVPTQAMTLNHDGYFGFGTATPKKKVHIEHTAGASEGILISGASDTNGHTAGILLRAEGGEADSALRAKGGIFFERFGTYGVGKLHIANRPNADNNSAAVADADITINDDKVGIGTRDPRAKLHVATGSLMVTPIDSAHNGAYHIIGSVSNYNTANGRYIHAQLSTAQNNMFHIVMEGYTYTTGQRSGRCSGYVYNYGSGGNGATGSFGGPGVYDGRVSGNIVAMFSNSNNARIEVVIDTGNSGTGNRWGSYTLVGGDDHISSYAAIEVVQYTTSSNAARQYTS